MKLSIITILLFLAISAMSQKGIRKHQAKQMMVTDLQNFKGGKAIFKTKYNHIYTVVFVPDSEFINAAPVSPCSNNNFTGTARKACKISIAQAPLVNMSFPAFLKSLPSDATMMADPNIKSAANNPRVAKENRNIALTAVFLYGIKRESDNDYHLIIGDKNKTFFNVEISGLPPTSAASYAVLQKARAKVEAYFGKPNCNMGGYMVFPQGISMQVSGSTFYDIDHAPGTVGPQGYTPNTAWEIHPVTDITFLK